MLRAYNLSDQNPLIKIFNLNIPEFFDPQELQHYIDYLEKHGDTYLTIEFENKIIGGVGFEFRASDKSGRINWIFLDPEFKGRGFGSKAVEHCLTILKSNPEVEILIVRTSQLAYRFFEKFGYKVTGTKKDYWGPGLDLYEMENKFN